MKEVAVLLLVALTLSGCSNNQTIAQTASGGIWQANLSGGEGTASGYSFITQFTVGSGGNLSVSNFQFLTSIDGGCFPVTNLAPTGILALTYNSAQQLIPPSSLTFTVTANGNTLTLTSTSVTGTINSNGSTLSGGMIVGNWAVTGGTGCDANGTFTMTQNS